MCVALSNKARCSFFIRTFSHSFWSDLQLLAEGLQLAHIWFCPGTSTPGSPRKAGSLGALCGLICPDT